jgi:hypothetical protein
MTLSGVVAATWFQTLGGWPNLLQGLGSSIIGGLVAALTAYLVVRWTHQSNLRAATELDARAVVRSLTTDSLKVLEDVQVLIRQPFEEVADRLRRLVVEIRLCRIRFATAFNVNYATIAMVDSDFVTKTLSPLVHQVVESFEATENNAQRAADAMELPEPDTEKDLAAISEAMRSLEAAIAQMNDFNGACATWLSERTSRTAK